MIFKFLCMMVLILFPSITHARPYDFNPQIPEIAKASDFRGFVWGVSRQDVKKYETAIFYKEEAEYIYFIEQPSKNDFRRLIRYEFLDNKLIAARYSYEELTTPNPDDIVDFYERFKKKISLSKGSAQDEKFIWRNRIYQRFPEMWNGAIRSGDLKIEAYWRFSKQTSARLSLSFKDSYYRLNYDVFQSHQDDIQGLLPIGNMSSFKVNP